MKIESKNTRGRKGKRGVVGVVERVPKENKFTLRTAYVDHRTVAPESILPNPITDHKWILSKLLCHSATPISRPLSKATLRLWLRSNRWNLPVYELSSQWDSRAPVISCLLAAYGGRGWDSPPLSFATNKFLHSLECRFRSSSLGIVNFSSLFFFFYFLIKFFHYYFSFDF